MPDPSPSILKPVLSLLQSPHTGMEGAEGEVQPNKGRDKHQGCCHRGQSSLGPTVQGAVGASVLQSLVVGESLSPPSFGAGQPLCKSSALLISAPSPCALTVHSQLLLLSQEQAGHSHLLHLLFRLRLY